MPHTLGRLPRSTCLHQGSECAYEGGGKGRSGKLPGAAAAAVVLGAAAAAPAADSAAVAVAADPSAIAAAPAADPAAAAAAAAAAAPAAAAAALAAAPAAEPAAAATAAVPADDPAAAAGPENISRGGRREWSGNGGEERSEREERWEDNVGPGEGPRGRRERVRRRSGVVRNELIEDDVNAADEAVGGGMEEQVDWGVAILPKVGALQGTGGELASGAGAIGRWDEDEGLAAPNAKAGSVRLGLRPEFCGGGGGMLRVGAEIVEEGGMEEGIAPKGRRGGGVSNEATSNFGDFTDATLSNAILLRGVGKGGCLLNAMSFEEGGEGGVDELTPTVRVKAANGAFEVIAALLSPVDDHIQHLVLGVKEKDGGVPTVVVDKDEHVPVPLTGADGIGTPEIHVDKVNGSGSKGGGEQGRHERPWPLHRRSSAAAATAAEGTAAEGTAAAAAAAGRTAAVGAAAAEKATAAAAGETAVAVAGETAAAAAAAAGSTAAANAAKTAAAGKGGRG
ncbi:unnamed protein product [Closterium sp. NIES-53]